MIEATSLPKISIITPSYNQGAFLEETITSILDQNYPNLEYIIIDGGSADNSVDIIKKYAHKIDYWISEPDKGQVDAILKGLQRCSGQIINWINSDDLLAENALFEIAAKYKPGQKSLICGDVINFGGKTKLLIENRNITLKAFLTNRELSYHQPGVWFSNIGAETLSAGLFPDFHYSFDHYLMVNLLSEDLQVAHTHATLAHFRLHDNSKTISYIFNFHQEFYKLFEIFLAAPRYSAYQEDIRSSIKHFKEKWDWKDKMLLIRKSSDSKIGKILSVGSLMLSNPSKYLNRTTLGTIKIILKED